MNYKHIYFIVESEFFMAYGFYLYKKKCDKISKMNRNFIKGYGSPYK